MPPARTGRTGRTGRAARRDVDRRHLAGRDQPPPGALDQAQQAGVADADKTRGQIGRLVASRAGSLAGWRAAVDLLSDRSETVQVSLDPFDGSALDVDAIAGQFASLLASSMGNVVGQMMELGKRLGADEGDEFASGLREVLHASIDGVIRPGATEDDVAVALRSLATFIDSWVMSSRLDGSADWHRQMKASDEALKQEIVGQPLAVADL